MKTLTLLISLVLLINAAFSQRIEKIPISGIELVQGWKWTPLDSANFKEVSYNDKTWTSIHPSDDITHLKVLNESSVGWLRLSFTISENIAVQSLVIVYKQIGLSDVYINGVLAKSIIDKSVQDISGIPLSNYLVNGQNVIAIRYTPPKISFWVRNFYKSNPAIKVLICEVENISLGLESVSLRSVESQFSGYFKAGVFFMLTLFHLPLYFSHKKQKANLYLGLYALVTFLLLFIENQSFLWVRNLSIRNMLSGLCMVLHPLAMLFGFLSITNLVGFKKDGIFWLALATCLGSMPLMIRPYDNAVVYGLIIPTIVVGVLVVIICWKKTIEGKQPYAFALFLASLIFVINYSLYILAISYLSHWPSYKIITEFTFSTSILAIPLALSYYLAKDFTIREKIAEKNLSDFIRVSDENKSILLHKNEELEAALLEGQTTERKRMASDLHDNLGSTLSSLRWGLESIDRNNLDKREKEVYLYVQETLDNAYNQVRFISHNLLPDELKKEGLKNALSQLLAKLNKGNQIHFSSHLEGLNNLLNPKVELELYSICLELINNVLKHSQAKNVTISFENEPNKLVFTFKDDGKGYSETETEGKGLKSIGERIVALNGVWTKEKDGGTIHRFEIPNN